MKKELLKEMKSTAKVSDLIGENGKHKLKVGKNIISVDGGKRRKVVIHTGDDSKVQKDMQDETDIKNILKKYGRTGMLPVMQNEALYGDFSSVPDFMEAQNIIIKANEQFSLLDSDTRKKFDNDPAKFLEFCGNPANKQEMYELGLAIKKAEPVQTIQKVEIINQPKAE